MKKFLRSAFVMSMLIALSGGIVGCGNSPDGDGQKPNDNEYGTMSDLYGPAGDGKAKR